MKSSQPEVLVVTPTEAGNEQTLSECSSSVAAQSVPVEHVWEIDDTYIGAGALRDLMISRSNAEWVLPLDDTDRLDPDHLETCLQHSDEADIVYSWCRVENGPVYNRLFNPKALMRFNYIPVTALIRRETWEKAGGFRHNNHWDLWLRALSSGARFKCVPEVTWTMRPQEARLWDLSIRHGAIQKPGELRQLVEFLQKREKPKVVCEVGTAVGGTLWLWCQMADPNAFIISIDLPNGPWGGGYAEEDIPRILTMTQHQQKMQLFRGDSHVPEMLDALKRVLTGRKIDMLFIDGDHSYGGVKQDWEMYSPLVRSGGIVVFHDIVPHDFVGCDVDIFWNELKGDYKHEEFITPVEIPYLMKPKSEGGAGKDWGGIGVIHIP